MAESLFVISSFCHQGGCVAVATTAHGEVLVRDEKDPSGPVLAFTAAEWGAFVAGVRNGEFEPVVS